MARVYGVEYPERPLMAVLSDLLGIDHYTTSRGSTVPGSFIRAVAHRLGVPDADGLTKDAALQAAIEAATLQPMDPSLFSRGSTITDLALQRIIDGVLANWQLGPAAPGPAPAPFTDPDGPPASDGLPKGQDALDMQIDLLEDLLDPDGDLGPVDRRLVAVAYREDQDSFRRAVLLAYRQSGVEACCITGHGPPQVLQAAHIVGHADGGPAVVSNGLCLRSDLHALLDRRLIAVHETTLEVLVHPVLEPTPYADLAGREIHIPMLVNHRPSAAALRHRRLAAGLGDDL